MLFREEYLEKVIRPKIMEAAEHKPKTIYDLCALFGLPPNSIHTVSAWLRELKIPVGDICELSLRARRMMESRGFVRSKSTDSTEPVASVVQEDSVEEEPSIPTKKKKSKTSVFKSKKKKKKHGGKPLKGKARRHI